jgi:hypothetical protein
MCVDCLQRLQERKIQKLQFIIAMRGRQTVCTLFSRAQYITLICLE